VTAQTITPNDDVTAASDRELLERVARQLDHLDKVLHEHTVMLAEHSRLLAEIRPLLPHIPRALALLDPGRSMRGYFAKRKDGES
jgi:hypothetical protein